MSRRPLRILPVASLVAVGLLFITLPITGQQKPESAPPAPGLVERTGVELLLLEVEAVDGEGRPLRGLQPADFIVRLDGRVWPIVSVDDLCSCAGPAGPSSPAAVASPEAVAPREAETDAGVPARFVLYMDFGQMRQGGRHQAVSLAKRWVQEVMTDRDEVMIAGYITRRGIVTLAEFTTDTSCVPQTPPIPRPRGTPPSSS